MHGQMTNVHWNRIVSNVREVSNPRCLSCRLPQDCSEQFTVCCRRFLKVTLHGDALQACEVEHVL